MAWASGRSRVTRRGALALPAARAAQTARSLPACMTPSTTSLYPPSPLTETSSGRPVPAASLARSRACPAYRVGQSSTGTSRSEEHTSELQSRQYLVCRLLLEKKKQDLYTDTDDHSTTPGPFRFAAGVRVGTLRVSSLSAAFGVTTAKTASAASLPYTTRVALV